MVTLAARRRRRRSRVFVYGVIFSLFYESKRLFAHIKKYDGPKSVRRPSRGPSDAPVVSTSEGSETRTLQARVPARRKKTVGRSSLALSDSFYRCPVGLSSLQIAALRSALSWFSSAHPPVLAPAPPVAVAAASAALLASAAAPARDHAACSSSRALTHARSRGGASASSPPGSPTTAPSVSGGASRSIRTSASAERSAVGFGLGSGVVWGKVLRVPVVPVVVARAS